MTKSEIWIKTKFTNVWHVLETNNGPNTHWNTAVCGREFNLTDRTVYPKPNKTEAVCFTCSNHSEKWLTNEKY